MTEYKLEIDYLNRINRALCFIDEHLEEDLNLERIAGIACYSPYHFHRIFKLMTDETLNGYINRKRLEKTALLLMTKKELSITDLALRYGFNSNSSFTRSFKKFYGLSPSGFRNANPDRYSKIAKIKSKNGKDRTIFKAYLDKIKKLKDWIDMNARIRVKDMFSLKLACISRIGGQNLASAFDELIRWAEPKGLMDDPERKLLTIYHDSFKVTEADKVRMTAGIVLDKELETEGEISYEKLEGGRFIVGSFKIAVHEFEKSWTGLFVWMNENGYKKADRDPFEIYHNNFNEHPEKLCIVDFYIPIK